MKLLATLRRQANRLYRRHFYVPAHILMGKQPVIIYSVGKVGSTSIYESLPSSVFWVQVHTLNPQEWEKAHRARQHQDISMVLQQSRQVQRYILGLGLKAKYITVVREPIGRNISAFFQGFSHFTAQEPSSKLEDQAEQAKIFLEHYPHERVLNFFETEYRTMLGIDVYATPFDHSKGYQHLTFERGELLVLRTESPDSLKEKVISEYLDLPDFRLQRANVRDEQQSGEAYRVFKQNLVLPENYIDTMLESRYCQHFYTELERQNLREKWTSKIL